MKVNMKSGFGLQLTASSPAFREKWPAVIEGKTKYLPGVGENRMGIRIMQLNVADGLERCTCLCP